MKDITLAVVAAIVAIAVIFSGSVLYVSSGLSPTSATPYTPPSGTTTPTPTGSLSLATLSLQPPAAPGPAPGSVVCGATVQSANAVNIGMTAGPAGPFTPQNVTLVIGKNSTVTWTNTDPKGITHTVTSNQGLFNSGDMAKGASFTCAFLSPGTYYYRCLYHPLMVGTIFVESQ